MMTAGAKKPAATKVSRRLLESRRDEGERDDDSDAGESWLATPSLLTACISVPLSQNLVDRLLRRLQGVVDAHGAVQRLLHLYGKGIGSLRV